MRLAGKRILVTGPTGMVAKPVCRSFAKENEVYAAARFSDAQAKEDLEEPQRKVISSLGLADIFGVSRQRVGMLLRNEAE